MDPLKRTLSVIDAQEIAGIKFPKQKHGSHCQNSTRCIRHPPDTAPVLTLICEWVNCKAGRSIPTSDRHCEGGMRYQV